MPIIAATDFAKNSERERKGLLPLKSSTTRYSVTNRCPCENQGVVVWSPSIILLFLSFVGALCC
jgi:hypothetical protein